MSDLRFDAVYGVDKEEWNKRNSLYNTLWFEVNKKDVGPDMEYCDTAIMSYRQNPFYGEGTGWEVDKDGIRKVLKHPDGTRIKADLMTGWWNPFKRFMRFQLQGINREELVKDLKNLLVKMEQNGLDCQKGDKKARNEAAAEWLAGETKRSRKACESCIDFLDVVYTPGNVMPTVDNPGGGGLDGWDTKLTRIKACLEEEKNPWKEYICNIFGTWKKFIEENKLQMYFANNDKKYEKVLSLWGENSDVKLKKAGDDDWENYFKNAHDRIEERNRIIAKRNKEVERDERDN
ncbi:MAG: hypothetical protein J1E03_11235 [Acetatifactor sp.]|nr:hypothetical protein [Acetatifactor sp.]